MDSLPEECVTAILKHLRLQSVRNLIAPCQVSRQWSLHCQKLVKTGPALELEHWCSDHSLFLCEKFAGGSKTSISIKDAAAFAKSAMFPRIDTLCLEANRNSPCSCLGSFDSVLTNLKTVTFYSSTSQNATTRTVFAWLNEFAELCMPNAVRSVQALHITGWLEEDKNDDVNAESLLLHEIAQQLFSRMPKLSHLRVGPEQFTIDMLDCGVLLPNLKSVELASYLVYAYHFEKYPTNQFANLESLKFRVRPSMSTFRFLEHCPVLKQLDLTLHGTDWQRTEPCSIYYPTVPITSVTTLLMRLGYNRHAASYVDDYGLWHTAKNLLLFLPSIKTLGLDFSDFDGAYRQTSSGHPTDTAAVLAELASRLVADIPQTQLDSLTLKFHYLSSKAANQCVGALLDRQISVSALTITGTELQMTTISNVIRGLPHLETLSTKSSWDTANGTELLSLFGIIKQFQSTDLKFVNLTLSPPNFRSLVAFLETQVPKLPAGHSFAYTGNSSAYLCITVSKGRKVYLRISQELTRDCLAARPQNSQKQKRGLLTRFLGCFNRKTEQC